MRISTKVRYAVMAMVDLAIQEEKGPVSLTGIALRQELPLPYLEQLFNKLKKAGLVQSSRGANGGYHLGRAAHEMRILDILRAVDKPLKATRCSNHPTQGCLKQNGRCLTHDFWVELDRVVETFLEKVSLADICHTHLKNSFLETSSCSAVI